MRLLEKVERKVVRESGRRSVKEGEEKDIDGEEINRVMGKLREGKATEIDGIRRGMEIWG